MVYFLIVTSLVLILHYHWKRRNLYKLANSLSGPPALPILGNALIFHCKEEELFGRMCDLIETYPSPCRVWLGPKLIIIVKTAEHIESLLTSSKANDKDDIYRFLKVFNGISLFTTNGAEWKKHRRFVTPFLGHKYIESYFYVMKKSGEILINKLEEKLDTPTFDIEHYLSRCYQDTVSEVLMGLRPDAQNGKIDYLIEKFHKTYILLHSRMLKLWLHPDILFHLSANGKEQLNTSADFRQYVKKGTDLIKNNKGHNKEVISVLENLLDAQENNPIYYSDQNLDDHIATLYSASEDTVTSITSYLLVLLGMYPHIQDKIVKEIETVLGSLDQNVEYKNLVELKYLDMCVKEVLRLFPIGPFILRKLNGDIKLDGRILPKDCTIVFSFYSVQKSSKHWEKPNEFYPEHFLPEVVSKRHPYAFLPFSAGPRSCPGLVFAYTAIKTITVMVLQRYVVKADGKLEDIKCKADISIRPIYGHRLRLTKRVR